MALLSLLSAAEERLHEKFFAAPLPEHNPGDDLSGRVGAFAYRLAGPGHIDRHSGETDRVVWMIEGKAVRPLTEIFSPGFLSNDAPDLSYSGLRQWHDHLSDVFADGFVVMALFKEPGIAIVMNDRFGRLPLYMASAEGRVMVSRQIFHLHQTLPPFEADRQGRAFHLLMGFPVGDSTLWKGVKRVLPGSAIVIRNNGFSVMTVNDGLLTGSGSVMSLKDAVAGTTQMLDKVLTGAAIGEPVLSMSGGLDARLLAACLNKNRLPFRMISYSDSEGTAGADVDIARQIASVIGKPLTVVDLPEPSGGDFPVLHSLKYGLNYCGMAFIIPFLREIAGQEAVLTGDGGDKLLAPLDGLPPVTSARSLAQYILRRHSLMPVSTAAALSGCSAGEITGVLVSLLEGLYRTDCRQTYADFLLRQRAFKWLFEGEDRNRWFVKHEAPLWSANLASFLLNVPASVKRGYVFYKEVLVHYDARLAQLPNANWGFDVTRTASVRRLLWRQKIKYGWPFFILLRNSTGPLPDRKMLPPFVGEVFNAENETVQGGESNPAGYKKCLETLTTENLYYWRSLLP